MSVVVGSLGDGGDTLARLADEHGFAEGTLDFVFLDHDKDAYLPAVFPVHWPGRESRTL